MLKLIATGLWVCVVTLGAVWFSIHRASAPPADAEGATAKIDTEVVKVETISIPVIGSVGVKGYFINRITLMVDRAKYRQAKLPADTLVTDALFTLLVGNGVVDLTATERFDLAAFKEMVRKGLNERFRDEVVTQVFVEQLDYLSRADVRANLEAQNHARPGRKIAEGETAPEARPPTGH